MSEFSEKLKEIRQKSGLSQKEVAEKLGITPASYNLYENGKREPNIEMLKKIADFFNVSVENLLNNKNSLVFDKEKVQKALTNLEIIMGQFTTTTEKERNAKEELLTIAKQQALNTIAAHFDGNEFTEEELEDIRNYAEFIKSRRKEDSQ